MKMALILVASLALTGVSLVATADSAAACTPPNCGTDCDVEWYYWFHAETVLGGVSVDRPVVDCGY